MTEWSRTNGIVDLIGRRAVYGQEKVRILDVRLANPKKGAEAQIRFLRGGKEKWISASRLKLVPKEDMPNDEA